MGDKLLNRKKVCVGDLVQVRFWAENEWTLSRKWVYIDLERMLSSSLPGETTIGPGEKGIVVECPTVWGYSDRICGVLFSDMKKYVPHDDLEVLRPGNESRKYSNR